MYLTLKQASLALGLTLAALVTPALADAPTDPPNVPNHYQPEQPAPHNAQQGWCTTVFEDGMQQRHCGTLDHLVWEAKVICAQYEALPNQNTMFAIHQWARCQGAKQAVNNIQMSIVAREKEQQRIEDAHRQLRSLGVEQ